MNMDDIHSAPGGTASTPSFPFLAGALLIVLAVFLCYLPALDSGFVHDDPLLILDDPLVVDPDAGFFDPFFRAYFGVGGGGLGFYRPLMTLMFRAEYMLYNGSARGFHFDNLLIHCSVCVLIFLLLLRLGVLQAAAFAAALVLGVHPAACESVAWISGRTDPLAFMFMVLSLLFLYAWSRARDGLGRGFSSTGFFMLSLLFCLVALLVKEIAYILPVTAFVAVFCRTRPGSGQGGPEPGGLGRAALAGCAFAMLVVLVCFAGSFMAKGDDVGFYFGQGSVWERGLTFLSVVPAYMGKIFFPGQMSIARPVSLVTSVFEPRVIAGALILITAGACVFYGIRRGNRAVALGAALFVTALLSVSNIHPIPCGFDEMDFPFFERYLYVPMAGLLIALAGLVPRRGGAAFKALLIALVLCVCPILGRAAWKRSLDWKDNVSLFSSGVNSFPESHSLWFNLGQAYLTERRDPAKALDAFEGAARLNPGLAMARICKGVALSDLGQYEDAVDVLERVVKNEPGNGHAHEVLGFVHAQAGRWLDALDRYARAAILLNGDASTVASRDEAEKLLRLEIEELMGQGREAEATTLSKKMQTVLGKFQVPGEEPLIEE